MKKLTVFSKILIFCAVIALTGFTLTYFNVLDLFNDADPSSTAAGGTGHQANIIIMPKSLFEKQADPNLAIALDQWHGAKAIIDANGGINDGQDGSIYDTLGLDVNIAIIRDDEESLQKFIDGEVVAVAVSVNRWAYVHAKLTEARVPAKMVYIADRSVGGDGIITTADISGIEGLAGHTIALSRYSAAHTMTEWLMKASSLPQEKVNEIRRNIIFTSSAEETLQMLASGQADVASFWEPYITQSHSLLGAKTLFSTRSAQNLVIHGIIFREDYLKLNPENVEKFIEGALRAVNEHAQDSQYIRQLDDYANLTDAEIFAMAGQIAFANFADNKELFNGTVQILYEEMADVWKDLGEAAIIGGSRAAFDSSYLLNVESKFFGEQATTLSFSETDRNRAATQTNTEVLLKQTLSINFEPNVANIQKESYAELEEFARVAKILNGAIIQVEGNVADTGVGNTQSGRLLSEQRAKAVCDYLIELGIDESRLIYVGNGITKPIPGINPRSTEGMQANRRTDISFIAVE